MAIIQSESDKKAVALAVLDFIEPGVILGIGSGSTVNCFIDALATVKNKIEAVVVSSSESEKRVRAIQLPVYDFNNVVDLELYIDSADEIDAARRMIKGGGGALLREKILATAAKKFICLVDHTKQVDLLGKFPLAIEVIPMARSFVARKIVLLGGQPAWREGFVTDNGNLILDVYNLKITKPLELEESLNNIPGVVANGLFAHRVADIVLAASQHGVQQI